MKADINLHFCLDLSTSLFKSKDEVLAKVDVVVVVEVIVKSDVFSNANFVSHYASTLTIFDRHRRSINFFHHLTAHDGVTGCGRRR